jgi:hypothetical protein
MNDSTVQRAVRHGAKTVAVEHKPHPKSLRGNLTLTPDEITTAMEMARELRIKRDIAAYAIRKRTA